MRRSHLRPRNAAIIVLALVTSSCSYDTFAALDKAVRYEWTEVQDALRRRNDLIPELVDLVALDPAHDTSLIRAVVDSRARLASARRPAEWIEAGNYQATVLAPLVAFATGSAELNRREAFTPLMQRLADVENAIAVGRMRYNAVVQQYTLKRRRFPGGLAAALFDLDDYPFFNAPPAAPGVPATSGPPPYANLPLSRS